MKESPCIPYRITNAMTMPNNDGVGATIFSSAETLGCEFAGKFFRRRALPLQNTSKPTAPAIQANVVACASVSLSALFARRKPSRVARLD
jgi:hypothetical protein